LIGSILGNRYRILREIGAGGMAKVYLSEDATGSDLVAVKVLYPQFGEDISFIQRFNREAKLASTLTDPHIVRVLDYGADRDLHYLVMEYVEGNDLNDTLQQQGRFGWRDALEIIDQLASALEHAHAHGVVHRDIKPQNMMLNDNGLLKVLDFGIARVPTLPSLTQSGFIGSPYYASPEQAMGEEVDIRSDIYSSGIVLYELLSGTIPFDAKSPWSIISQHITSEPPPIELPEGTVPDNVLVLLHRMLAKRPEDRFQSPTRLREAIAAVLAGQPVPSKLEFGERVSSVDNHALVESLVERAESAIESAEWARAVDLLSQAARMAPDDKQLARRLTVAETEARLTSLYRSGKRAMDGKKWEEAINHFNVIIELKPGYEDTQRLIDECHRFFKEENTQQFVATRYQEGLGYFETERWDSAVEAFTEVQEIMPNYEDITTLLAEAKTNQNPGLGRRLSQIMAAYGGSAVWRWGAVAAGIVLILLISFLFFGSGNQVAGEDDLQERLKQLYTDAQAAIEAGDDAQAVALLEEVLAENPDYADAAQLRRDLIATPTPTPSPTATPTPEADPLDELLAEAQDAVISSEWSTGVDRLLEIRETNADYEAAQVTALLCDALVGRGLNVLNSVESETEQVAAVAAALTDFETGAAECPRRTDLQEQSERSAAYLTALEIPPTDYDDLIPILTPIVAASPNFAGGYAKKALYDAYLGRAMVRETTPETAAAALGDYEAALALNVDDPSEAQIRRAELLLSFAQQSPASEPPTEPTPTVATTAEPVAAATPTPEQTAVSATSTPIRIKYSRPTLIGPVDDSIYAGRFADVVLEWEPVGDLAPDEYYDLTIMHLFADQPQYNGSQRTRETAVRITQDIGVGEAGGDRFYWWVTVRKDNTASAITGNLDAALSPRSEAGTFVWSP
jgi:serine/threonine protein kinase